MKKPLGLYVHIPFCVRKCKYCDFLSFEGEPDMGQLQYVNTLLREIRQAGTIYGRKYYVNTIFFGGGTPSILDEILIKRILDVIYEEFEVKTDEQDGFALPEITIEANPGTLTGEKLEEYRRSGVNRLSLGVQSFHVDLLRTLGRIHPPEQAKQSYKLARELGFENINFDLMFGLPGQTPEMWKQTLEEAIAMEPEHISFYSLELEEGTPFAQMYREGRLELPDEDIDRDMYHTAIDLLKKNGYVHYEISNAAKPGFECRHNLKYWSMEEYLGLGLGAHSYVDGMRFKNVGNLGAYNSTDVPRTDSYRNTEKDDMSDYLFTGLRKIEGISLQEFKDRFHVDVMILYRRPIQKHLDGGLLELKDNGSRLALSALGLDNMNKVLQDLL